MQSPKEMKDISSHYIVRDVSTDAVNGCYEWRSAEEILWTLDTSTGWNNVKARQETYDRPWYANKDGHYIRFGMDRNQHEHWDLFNPEGSVLYSVDSKKNFPPTKGWKKADCAKLRLSITKIPAQPISDAGSPNANGCYSYKELATDTGKPWYNNEHGCYIEFASASTKNGVHDPQHWALWSAGANAFDDRVLYSVDSEDDAPPTEGWEPAWGHLPAPTFE